MLNCVLDCRRWCHLYFRWHNWSERERETFHATRVRVPWGERVNLKVDNNKSTSQEKTSVKDGSVELMCHPSWREKGKYNSCAANEDWAGLTDLRATARTDARVSECPMAPAARRSRGAGKRLSRRVQGEATPGQSGRKWPPRCRGRTGARALLWEQLVQPLAFSLLLASLSSLLLGPLFESTHTNHTTHSYWLTLSLSLTHREWLSGGQAWPFHSKPETLNTCPLTFCHRRRQCNSVCPCLQQQLRHFKRKRQEEST